MNDEKIRVLKDGGCQSNFISDKFASKHKLKVLEENIEITVYGIKTSKKYLTKLVQLSLFIGEKVYILEALSLPSIRISLNIPGLSEIAQTFVAKGYTLADELLLSGGDVISNIDFILGAKSGYCIPDR